MRQLIDKLNLIIKVIFAGLVFFALVVFLCLAVKDHGADHMMNSVVELDAIEMMKSLSFVNFVLAISLLIIAFMAIIIGLILSLSKKMKTPITSLGVGVLFTAVWIIFDSRFFQFVFQRYYMDGIMSYIMIFLIPFPFIYYLDILQEKRYRSLYTLTCLFLEVTSFICIIVYLAFAPDFLTMMPVTCVIEGAVVACVLYALIKDFRDGSYRRYFLSFVGVGGMVISCIAELILLMFVGDKQGGSFIIIGLFWTIMLGILHQLYAVREAQEKAAMAVRASETKTNFLANMSHEIRTPMNAILGMDEMILREAGGNPKIMKYALDIKSAGNMLLSIINGILDLSKIESGKAELVEIDFDIRSVINDLVNIVKKRASDKNLKFSFDVAADIPTKYHGDETRVRQIMLNIINNAVKYTNEGSVSVMLGKDSDEQPEGKVKLVLTVKDTGIGIREEDIGKLFQPFDRLEQTKNRNIEGTGLGLNIAATYVRLMGGRIDVESVYGQGSVFTVSMPLTVLEDAPIGDISRTINDMHEAGDMAISYLVAPGASILVIDDNEMNLEVISGLLERTRMKIDLATSGPDGIALMKKKRYDIILLDQMMPGLDGISTLKKMHTEFDMQGIPVIALTADAVTGAREYYLENGFDDYLSKPVKPDELEEALVHYLPKKLVAYRDLDNTYDKTRTVGSLTAPQPEASHTMLAIDDDKDALKDIKEKTGRIFRGTFVTDTDKARKYLDSHDVDYVLVKGSLFQNIIAEDSKME